MVRGRQLLILANRPIRPNSFELEMLAIVRVTERFHLYGLCFTVVTDCNALVYAVHKANLNSRIARWTLALQNYNFKLIHRPCGRMRHVDALSRSVAYVNEVPLECERAFNKFKEELTSKPVLSIYDPAMVNGLVYKKVNDSLKFVIPDAMIRAIMCTYHDNLAHVGRIKTFEGIARSYWFPSMRKKIHNYVDNCFVCIMRIR